MAMREENPHAGGKWETMNLLGVALNLQGKGTACESCSQNIH